jgi:hypothetical protein
MPPAPRNCRGSRTAFKLRNKAEDSASKETSPSIDQSIVDNVAAGILLHWNQEVAHNPPHINDDDVTRKS